MPVLAGKQMDVSARVAKSLSIEALHAFQSQKSARETNRDWPVHSLHRTRDFDFKITGKYIIIPFPVLRFVTLTLQVLLDYAMPCWYVSAHTGKNECEL